MRWLKSLPLPDYSFQITITIRGLGLVGVLSILGAAKNENWCYYRDTRGKGHGNPHLLGILPLFPLNYPNYLLGTEL